MKHRRNMWSLVLAGGDGTRLRGLTRNVHGAVVPKQFCSLHGGPSLLQEALQRAATVAPMQHVCTVVAAQHRHWWKSMLSYLPDQNVIVQPHNRGTAHGILLPLLKIVERDPEATLVLVPADHYLRNEEIMIDALRGAAEMAHDDPTGIYVLGVEPEEADPELGYILPATTDRSGATPVLKFVEKPTDERARELLRQGALWNSFIMASSAQTLMSLFARNFDSAITAIRTLEAAELDMAYQHLKSVDFSRDVLQGNEARLKVVAVPACGWTDLGTPQRVGLTLMRLRDDDLVRKMHPYSPIHLNLADQFSRLENVELHA